MRGYYRARGAAGSEAKMKRLPGQFTYSGGSGTLAMAAAGVVCMQEFGQYD
ncbi:MAG: squalene--hopene cyclase, partial [Planctomycetes bacterium]|nr:squalene--hopene cyclase [Planctomycetota bacterium]